MLWTERRNDMTHLEALEIKSEFTVAMQFSDYGGKSRVEALAEPAKKYSKEKMAEAYAVLCRALDEEKEVLRALFVLAIKSNIGEGKTT
jgi:hypothetical protein